MYSLIKSFPIVRGYRASSLPYHVGGVWENRFGVEVLRSLSQHVQSRLRRRKVDSDIRDSVQTLDREGIVVFENYLSESDFARVVHEYEAAFFGVGLRPYKGVANGKLHRAQIALAESRERFPGICQLFERNARLSRIASAVVRRRPTGFPKVHLDLYKSLLRNDVDNDVENVLHADLHTPTIKMFFFIDDVDASNGAFIYALGSHRLTVARLIHEYDLSNRQAKLRNEMPIDRALVCRRGDEVRNIVDPRLRSRMRITESQVAVKKNTLVIANNMGFHRRGEFSSEVPRRSIQINFRYLEQPLGKGLFRSEA